MRTIFSEHLSLDGNGDWRVLDAPNTVLTLAQADSVIRLGEQIDDLGAAEVRFDRDAPGDLIVWMLDGSTLLLTLDGATHSVDGMVA